MGSFLRFLKSGRAFFLGSLLVGAALTASIANANDTQNRRTPRLSKGTFPSWQEKNLELKLRASGSDRISVVRKRMNISSAFTRKRKFSPKAEYSIIVTTTNDDDAYDSYQSDTTASGAISIRSAIRFATNGSDVIDTIFVPAGYYALTNTGADEDNGATGDFDVYIPVTIMGSGASNTIIDGIGADRVFDINPGGLATPPTVYILNLTVRGGATPSGEDGGGIRIDEASLYLGNVDILSNAAGNDGGGIDITTDGAALWMVCGRIDSNTAYASINAKGGGANFYAGVVEMDSVEIAYDSSGYTGAGIQNNNDGPGADITLNNCTLYGNTSLAGYGAGLDNDAGTVAMNGGRISHNVAEDAAGLEEDAGQITISNASIDSNYVNECCAGGLAFFQGPDSLINVTITGNEVPDLGAGLYTQTQVVIIGSSIIENQAGVGGGIYNEGPLAITNSSIDSNFAAGFGGGIDDETGGIIWAGGSLSGNIASFGSGGGLFFNASSANDTLSNISMVGNSPDNIYDNTGGSYLVVLNDIALPVQVASFAATSDAGSITLSWQTASEVNNAGFNMLREDPHTSSYRIISSYTSNNSLKGLGTSTTGKTYSFTDSKVTSGSTYLYKIESVSTGGSTTELNTVSATVEVPKEYALYQNYPNPFNPATTIRFDLKQQSTVTLEIYNALGQRVEHWNYGMMDAGRYNEVVNMDKFASGIYYYKLVANGVESNAPVGDNGDRFVSLKKLVLLK